MFDVGGRKNFHGRDSSSGTPLLDLEHGRCDVPFNWQEGCEPSKRFHGLLTVPSPSCRISFLTVQGRSSVTSLNLEPTTACYDTIGHREVIELIMSPMATSRILLAQRGISLGLASLQPSPDILRNLSSR